MKSAIRLLAAAPVSLALMTPALAAVRTVILAVPGMTCGVCPITVHKALEAVPGVQHVRVNEARKDVAVTFDNAKANVKTLVAATTDAGYPSHVLRAAQ